MDSNNSKRSFNDIESKFKTILKSSVLTIFSLISVVLLLYSIYFFFKADNIGSGMGSVAGKSAGKIAGSYYGIKDGLAEGKDEGIEKGLSAEDTEVKIGNSIYSIGKLEVLSASVVLHDVLEQGEDYKSLLAFYGDLIFTVDLSNTQIDVDNDRITVKVPSLQHKLIINDEKTEQLVKKMKHKWSGSSENGYQAALNSIKEMQINAEEKVSNYDSLKSIAEESAKKQIVYLINSASAKEVVVNVEFQR